MHENLAKKPDLESKKPPNTQIMKNIAIFASGSGTNAENLIQYFHDSDEITIKLLLSNKKDAFVLERARKHGIESINFSREDFYGSRQILNVLKEHQVDYLVLAGFLWLIPEYILDAFPNRILNIHPALLPKYGGKGMYGMHVHREVIKQGETHSGISIHLVNKEYDKGKILFQATVPVSRNDTPDDLAQKVHELEYEHYPRVVEAFITGEMD